jgi:uncharacterized membrane protein YgcG
VALHDASGVIDGIKATVSAAMAAVAAASRVRILDRFYRAAAPGALETLAALGVPAAPSVVQYRAVLIEAASGAHGRAAAVTAAMRVLCHWAYDDEGEDEEERADTDADAEAEQEGAEHAQKSDVHSHSPFVRSLLAALSGHAVLPTAAGGWASPEALRFLDDTSPPGRLLTPSGGGGGGASHAHTLSAAALAASATLRAPAGSVIKDLETNLRRFYCGRLRLPLLSAAARESVVVRGDVGVERHAASQAPLRAAAAVLQRWSAGALPPQEREALCDALTATRVVRLAEGGTLAPQLRLRGAPLLVGGDAHTAADALPDEPLLLTQPGALAASPLLLPAFLDAEAAPTPLLYVLSDSVLASSADGAKKDADARAACLAQQLYKLLPPAPPHAAAAAAAAVAPLLRAALAAAPRWRRRHAADADANADADAFCDAAGLAPRPEGEATWLADDVAACDAADADAIEEAETTDVADVPADVDADAPAAVASPHARAVLDGAMAAARALSARHAASGGGGSGAKARRGGSTGTSLAGGGIGSGNGGGSGGGGIGFALDDAGLPLRPPPRKPPPAAAAAAAVEDVWSPAAAAPPSARAAADAALASALAALPPASCHVSTASSASAAAVGRAGEAYVAALLSASPEHSSTDHVRWVNAAHERGLPYDIEIVRQKSDAGSDGGGAITYVEVKTTTMGGTTSDGDGDSGANEKRFFDISSAELEWARRHGERYHIYRVFLPPPHGGAGAARVVRVVDPVGAVARGTARLIMHV